MRISTNTFFDAGLSSMLRQQETLQKTQQQVATGRRVLSPADDPVAAVAALDTQQAIAINDQFANNRGAAMDRLGLTDSTLASITSVIQDARAAAVAAGNTTLTAADRASYATQLAANLQDLLGLANSTDGNGQYLFSGYQGTTQPFALTAAGASYLGDDGQRMVQVSASRQLAVSESGADLLQRIRTGNGSFDIAAAAANAGTGIVDAGSVSNPALLSGHDYQVSFSVAGAASTYDVVDTTTGTTVLSAQPYTSGGSIAFDGMQFAVSGAPANGDAFTVSPSANQSLFATITSLIGVLQSSANGPAALAQMQNGVSAGIQNLDQALNNVLRIRSGVGASLQEIDALDTSGSDRKLQYQQRLSDLQDVDYAQAISQMNAQQITLEAAQKSFAAVSGLSLFKFL